jgi:hypothetical protein
MFHDVPPILLMMPAFVLIVIALMWSSQDRHLERHQDPKSPKSDRNRAA